MGVPVHDSNCMHEQEASDLANAMGTQGEERRAREEDGKGERRTEERGTREREREGRG